MMASKLDYPKRHAGLFRKPGPTLARVPGEDIDMPEGVSVAYRLVEKLARRSRKVAKKAPAPAKTKGKR
jgi:hypothetical protein